MRLQHIRSDEVQITFISSLPQNTTGQLALVTLDVFSKVLSRSVETLICEGVLSGGLFLASGNTQQASSRTEHQLRCYSICLYTDGAFIHISIKPHIAEPIPCSLELLLRYCFILGYCTNRLGTGIYYVGHNNLILYSLYTAV